MSISREDWQHMLTAYAEAVESGAAISPNEFDWRVLRLRTLRGLSPSLAAQLREAGNVSLLREVEAMTDEQIAALNTAAAERA